MLRTAHWSLVAAIGLVAATCGAPPAPDDAETTAPAAPVQPEAPPPAATSVTFVDVTEAAGIEFVHTSGAAGEKYLPETLGSGALFLDVDGDGWQDIFFVNSTPWPGAGETFPALYRNDGDGTFTDITAGSGLGVALYGLGGAAADYDNDGHVDLYVTALGSNRLFRGRGDGTFEDVTAPAGVGDETDIFCTLDGEAKSYCTPESYPGQRPTLYRNRGDGTFEDVTVAAGLDVPSSKALGVAMLDFDADGWMDFFVANDTEPDQLFRNRGDGTFEDVGLVAGVAFSEGGVARAGMGVDAADYDGSGRPSLVVGNFSNEMIALFHNEGGGLFIDEAPRSEVGSTSLLTLAFACFFFDYDLDGRPDIFAANGHVADDIERVQARVTYAQSPHLFRNLGGGRFEEAAPSVGPALAVPMVARGAAYADYDRDGDLDLLVTINNGPARLLRNDGGSANNVLRVRTVGVASNRDGVGARVEVTLPGGGTSWQRVKTGSSYASQSELPLTFGLGRADAVDAVRVTWPSGQVDDLGRTPANRRLTVREGEGLIASEAIVEERR